MRNDVLCCKASVVPWSARHRPGWRASAALVAMLPSLNELAVDYIVGPHDAPFRRPVL